MQQNLPISESPQPELTPLKTSVGINHYRKAAEMIHYRILKSKSWEQNTAEQIEDDKRFIRNVAPTDGHEDHTSLLHCLLSASLRLFQTPRLTDGLIPRNPPEWDYTVHLHFTRTFRKILEKGFQEHYPDSFPMELYKNRSMQLRTLKLMIDEAKMVMEHRGLNSSV